MAPVTEIVASRGRMGFLGDGDGRAEGEFQMRAEGLYARAVQNLHVGTRASRTAQIVTEALRIAWLGRK